MGQPVTTTEIRGERIVISVSSDGSFNADYDDQTYSELTLKALKEKLDKVVKAAQQAGVVDVTVVGLVPRDKSKRTHVYDNGPFEQGIGVLQAKLRSKHERQWNCWLLVTDDGKKFKIQGSREGKICRRLTEEECQLWITLSTRVKEAEVALEQFEDSIAIEPDEALGDARAAKKGGARG